jgi:hypothetical protein
MEAYDKAKLMSTSYLKNPKNLDKNKKIKKLTEEKIDIMITSTNETLEENNLPTFNSEDLKKYLCNEFNELGLFGKNEIYQSPSLTIIRNDINTSCKKVEQNKDVIFKNGFYFFECLNNKVGSIPKTKLNVKKATAGMFFTNSGQPNRELNWNEIKEGKEIANPEKSLKPVQATKK